MRILVGLLVAVLTLGWGSPASAKPMLRVGVAYAEPGGLNASVAKGLDAALDELAVAKVKTLKARKGEPDSAKVARLRRLAALGYNPVIAVGWPYEPALEQVAAEYPRVRFAIVDSASVRRRNITNLVFAEKEEGFLAGAVAALSTTSRTVGFLGGVHVPLLKPYEKGFGIGARAVDPGITVENLYLTEPPDFAGFWDARLGERGASALIERGVDVIFDVTDGAGSGVRRACRTAGIRVIGADIDVARQLPAGQKKVVVASVLKRADYAVFDFLKRFIKGKGYSGTLTYGIKNQGLSVTGSWPEIDILRKRVISGEIKL